MKHFLSIALAALLSGSAFATTIVSDTFNGFSSGSGSGFAVVTWTETGSYTNVTIGANLATANGLSTSTGTAYLMNQIGPGTTASNEVTAPFAISVSGNPGINVMTQLFTGLSLGPGTYFLVVVPDQTNTAFSLDWALTTPALQTLDTGVTQGPDLILSGPQAAFAPASNTTAASFNRIFSVTGTAVTAGPTIPEPSTIGTMLAGILAFGFLARKRRGGDRLLDSTKARIPSHSSAVMYRDSSGRTTCM